MSLLGLENAIVGRDSVKLENILKKDKKLAVASFSIGIGNTPRRAIEQVISLTDDTKLAEILLSYGANPNTIGSFGPIINETVSTEMIEVLLRHGADPNIRYSKMYPLDRHFDFDKASLLIKYGANPFYEDGRGRSGVEKAAYEYNQDENAKKKYELFQQAEADYLKRWETIKKAILEEDLEKIKEELKNNFDLRFVDTDGLTPYKFAVKNGKSEAATLLKTESKSKKKKSGCFGILVLLVAIFTISYLLV